MSKVLSIVATVASIASLVPGPHQGPARLVATVASVGAAITAKPPAARGSSSNVQIGSNMPSTYPMGRTFIGGNLVLEKGYGGEVGGVDNPYKALAFIWSAVPIQSIQAFQGDFTTIAFSGGNAVGYYHDFLYLSTSLGAMPQASALAGPWGAIPGWGASAKLSGKAHGLASVKFDKKGKKWASGLPQFGVVALAVWAYDPRKDSTWPGGSGAHRWDDETTWEWSDNPGLHGLTYARGRYQNPATQSGGKKVFGCGYRQDQIHVDQFVELANVCDANGWKVGGTIYEPGSRKDNLKEILEAGGGEPVFGAKLGVRFAAPKVALDTISRADLADGDFRMPGMRSVQEKRNIAIPKYRSEEHKWEYVQTAEVRGETWIAEDGEEKSEEWQWNLVQDKDQVAQLAAYRLASTREIGPIVLPVKPRLKEYRKGEVLLGGADLDELGLAGLKLEILDRQFDPATLIVTLTLATETDAKHTFALGQSGTAPPSPTLVSPEDSDTIVSANLYRSTPHVVASEAEMLALNVAEGEVAIRTDVDSTFIHNGGATGTAADWTEAPSPAAPVSSVAGKVGVVTLEAADITDFPEAVRDRMAATLVAGANITITVDDPGDTITIAASGGSSYTDENAQDAVGAMVDSTLEYVDATPLLRRAALTGDVTAAAGSNATTVVRINGVSLAGLTTGILKNATGTGVPSIAVAADFPTLNQNTTGSAATLTTARTIDGQSFNGSANITVIAPGTAAATSKATPVDADQLPLVDSAASNVLKKLTWANLKATLKTYFDTLYGSLASANTWSAQQIVSLTNSDFTNIAGANTHLLVKNPSGSQSSIYFDFAGTLRGKIRADSAGNLNYAANGGAHVFKVGGDSGVGTDVVQIDSTGVTIWGKFNASGEMRGSSLRIDAGANAAPGQAVTHKIAISLNGTSYYMLLSNV